MSDAAGRIRAALTDAARGLVEREVLLELVALSAVAREHILVIGPPGTAKSEAVRRVAAALGGQYFEYLVGRFTEPSELFGPVDLARLREGVLETRTEGMLPEADVAFLDELFLGSTAILNTLLGILNERTFRRGAKVTRCPLRVCVAAANAVPEDPALAALADRFLVRVYVEPVPEPFLDDLLEAGWAEPAQGGRTARIDDLDTLAAQARAADLGPVRPLLSDALRVLRGEGIALSDRRVVRVQRLVAAAAVLAGRSAPGPADLWPLVYAVPDPDGQVRARAVLRDRLEASESATLSAAVVDASQGPLARAARIAAAGEALLAVPPEAPDARARWRLELEGVAREIDASLAPDALPDLRARIVQAVGAA